MKSLPLFFLAATGGAACFLAPLHAAETVEIKQHWLAGKKYSFSMAMNQDTDMNVGGQKMHQKMNMTMDFTSSVQPPDAQGKKRLVTKFGRMVMDNEMAGQKMHLDSADAAANAHSPLAGALPGFLGKEIRMLLDANDQVSEIENLDEVFGGLPNGGAMAGAFNKDSIKQMMRQGMLQAFPKKPVSVGESWPFDTSLDLAGMGKFQVKGTYTLKSVGPHAGAPRCAEIALEGNMNADIGSSAKPAAAAPDPAAAGATPPGAPQNPSDMLAALGIKIVGKGMTGVVWFDLGLGMVRESDSSQSMAMSMNNPAQPTEKLDVPISQKVTVTLTKVEDLK